MSNRKLSTQRRGRRMQTTGRAWLVAALGVIVACSGENPVATAPQSPAPAQLAQEQNYSFSISPTDRTVRVRFTRIRSDGTESVSAFMQRMFASADSAGATKLVVDLSAVKGGDAFLVVPLVKGVLARERFARPGGLVVIVGAESFSQAQSAASILERYANPVFLQEAIP